MAHGLELRSPFLDTAVMEFAAGLPDRLRRRGRTLKWLLKEAFADLLPREIRSRPKWGFGVPLPIWFRTHWKPLFEGRVLGAGREALAVDRAGARSPACGGSTRPARPTTATPCGRCSRWRPG